MQYVLQTSERRTYGNQQELLAVYHSSKQFPLIRIFVIYADAQIINIKHFAHYLWGVSFQMSFKVFFIGTVIAALPVFFRRNKEDRRLWALIVIFLLSFSGPVGWFVIFKYHALSHTHMNFVIWHMPAVILGSVLMGSVFAKSVRYFFNLLVPVKSVSEEPVSCSTVKDGMYER